MSVSETEMREFFQRVIDSVAELSTQANRVEGLVQQVNDLTNRFSTLEQEHYNVKNQLAEANAVSTRLEAELNSTKSQLDNERAVSQSLRDTIVQRDAGVVQLENSFRQEQDAHKITTSERDDARQKISELNEEVERHIRHVNDLSTDRDHWRSKASDLEATNVQLKQQLEKINSVLNPLRVVSTDVA